ncbi:hypothetical protein PM082_017044 [Marasmius tenuissimus]|nr:hypothetical protein PM082_017044 [Marasmius tenuissimus]
MPASIVGLRVGSTVLYVIALIVTAYRLCHRARIRRLSWDDGCAFIAALVALAQIICVWLLAGINDLFSVETPEFGRAHAGLYWTLSVSFTILVSFTRISLWLSIRRILVPSKLKVACSLLIAGTLVSSVTLIVVKAATCSYSGEARVRSSPILCPSNVRLFVMIFQSIVDISLSVLLVVIPIRALLAMELPRSKRNLLISVFAGSIATLIGALVHNVFILRRNPLLAQTCHYEASDSTQLILTTIREADNKHAIHSPGSSSPYRLQRAHRSPKDFLEIWP